MKLRKILAFILALMTVAAMTLLITSCDDEETEDGRLIWCGWQNYYDPDTRLCDFDLTVFSEDEDGRYSREDESHTERCYTLDELTAALTACGFELLGVHGDFDAGEPDADCERWYIVARAIKN